MQRFGSDLNLTQNSDALLLDGVYQGPAHDRRRLERLCLYVACPPLSFADDLVESDSAFGEIEAQVLGHLTDLINEHDTVREVPFALNPLEAVFVATADDGLKWELRCGLEHNVIGTGGRCIVDLFYLDSDVRREVSGPQRSVLVNAISRSIEASDGGSAHALFTIFGGGRAYRAVREEF